MGRFDFLYKMDLHHRAVAVYIYLADRANRDGECWPAIPTIARELKLSQSTVRRALQDLRKVELLETEQRYRVKGGKSSLLFRLKNMRKENTCRQGTITLSWWQVPPVIMVGAVNVQIYKYHYRKENNRTHPNVESSVAYSSTGFVVLLRVQLL